MNGEEKTRSFEAPQRLGDFDARVALPLAGYHSQPYARLVDPQGVSCGTGKPTEDLSALQMYANDAYTSGSGNITSTLLKSLTCTRTGCTDGTTSASIKCQVSATCAGGVVLVPFHTTAPQPFIDVAPTDQTTPAPFGVGLASLTLSAFTPTPAQASQFLTPVSVANTSDPKNELGMPVINDVGQLLDMNTKAIVVEEARVAESRRRLWGKAMSFIRR